MLTVLFFSCEKNETNDLLPDVDVNFVIDMRLPKYQNLQFPGNWMYIDGEGINGILIVNKGGKSDPYKVFDRACPNNSCNTKMEFDGRLKLKCSCDNIEYSIYDGSPQDKKYTRFAREYKASQNSFYIHITNY